MICILNFSANYDILTLERIVIPMNQERIIMLKLDIIFKRIFGNENNKNIIAAFISDLLEIPREDIKAIYLSNVELAPEYIDQKFSRLDIKMDVVAFKMPYRISHMKIRAIHRTVFIRFVLMTAIIRARSYQKRTCYEKADFQCCRDFFHIYPI